MDRDDLQVGAKRRDRDQERQSPGVAYRLRRLRRHADRPGRRRSTGSGTLDASGRGHVSQARREWLRQTTRRLACLVVCSDPTAGLECPVTTDEDGIAAFLANESDLGVVFCTYQSLRR